MQSINLTWKIRETAQCLVSYQNVTFRSTAMPTTRIPTLSNSTRAGAQKWLAQMHKQGLLFHPDDNPHEITGIADGKPTFTQTECEEVTQALQLMFLNHGDAVYELAMDVVSRTFHTPAERKAIAALNG
jgi:hypothetical protein